MATLTRKQREIAAREEQILDVAQRLLLERGYHGLTMDRIATAIDYSKGTVYQHFQNKEDLLVAVMMRSCTTRLALFERAATFRGSARERMTAIGVAVELFHHLYPHFEQIESLLRSDSLRARASETRLGALEAVEARSLDICFGITRDAVASGDLALPDGYPLQDVTMGLWSLFQGTFDIVARHLPYERLGLSDPLEVLWRSASALLDGCGWRPLSTELDYDAVRERVHAEVFAEERRRADRG